MRISDWSSDVCSSDLLLHGTIAVDCPVRLLHGQRDEVVPWRYAITLAQQLRSADVQTLLIKDGDHRLSRDQDIARLIEAVATLPESIRSEEHTSELQSLMRISYAVFCLKKNNKSNSIQR